MSALVFGTVGAIITREHNRLSKETESLQNCKCFKNNGVMDLYGPNSRKLNPIVGVIPRYHGAE